MKPEFKKLIETIQTEGWKKFRLNLVLSSWKFKFRLTAMNSA